MQVDQEIKRAVDRAAQRVGNYAELAKAIGISQSILSRIKNNLTDEIEEKTWTKVHPFVAEFLPKDDVRYLPRATGRPAARPPVREPARTYPPLSTRSVREVPVLDAAQVAAYEPSVEGWAHYLAGLAAGETYPCVDAAEGWFALQSADTLFVVAAQECPADGDLVLACIAKTRKTEVGRYHRQGEDVSLDPDDGGETVRWRLRAYPVQVLWVWPVEMAVRLGRRRLG